MAKKLAVLESILRENAPLAVAYSGGVDSACLLSVAHRTLGAGLLGVIADSPSLPRQALADALAVAGQIGAKVEVIPTAELDDPRYAENPVNRCYFCKAELFRRMDALARARGFSAIAYGENADDPAHLRPGSKAAGEFAVLAPLRQAGFTKTEVRALSSELGLPTADAPSQPCLSSRIPHGTRVTRKALGFVERGEAAVRALGFRIFRVRYIDGEPPSARLQVDPVELRRADFLRDAIERELQTAGFLSVEIDPDGYRPTS